MAGVSTVGKSQASAPKPRAAAPAQAQKPRMAGDRLQVSNKNAPISRAAHNMRKGIFEFAGGVGLMTAGAAGVALTLSAPAWVPLAFGAAAVGGTALAVKGIHDYGEGMAQLVVDVLLLPVHIARAFTKKPAEGAK